MNLLLNIWNESSAARRALYVGLVALLLVLFFWATYSVMAPTYQVVFRNLRPQDAATITAELDKQKIKYRLDAGGASVLVPESQVHAARIKVLGKDLPLSGTVGFELFNNADLGLTEFAQKVNYQRALQGELARTIMSLEVVDSARVHLTLPDSGYLRRAGSKPKASVAIALKAAGGLDKATTRSIQRLVAAAVPDLEIADVAVVNQSLQGTTASIAESSNTQSTDPRLEQKFELEEHYTRRILAQADKVFGPGKTQVNVDVVLNFDQTKVLHESSSSLGGDERPAKSSVPGNLSTEGGPSATAMDQKSDASLRATDAAAPLKRSSQRRVEEVTVATGAIRRLNIGVLVDGRVERVDLERFKALLASSVGLVVERGDNLTVFNTNSDTGTRGPDQAEQTAARGSARASGATGENASSASAKVSQLALIDALSICLVVAVLLGGLWFIWHKQVNARRGPNRSLSDVERAALVRRLSELLDAKAAG